MKDEKQPSDALSGSSPKKRSGWKMVRKSLGACALLSCLLIGLVYFFLPRIAEKVIYSMIADADLKNVELKVREVGWRSAVIEGVEISDHLWSLKMAEIRVNYDPFDLFEGKIAGVVLEGVEAEIEIADAPESGGGISVEGIHQFPYLLEKIGEVEMPGAEVTVSRGRDLIERRVDVKLTPESEGEMVLNWEASDCRIQATMENRGDTSNITVKLEKLQPEPFLQSLEILLAAESPYLPEGLQLAEAELLAELEIQGDIVSPLRISGQVRGIDYGGEDQLVRLLSREAELEMLVEFEGAGSFELVGKMDELSLPLDSSFGLELAQHEKAKANWQFHVEWGESDPVVTGRVNDLVLSGEYNGRPVLLEKLALQLKAQNDVLQVKGSMENGGINIPLNYEHLVERTDENLWLLGGKVEVGPVKHHQQMPLLAAFADAFEEVEFIGKSHTTIEFTTGSHRAFEGEMVCWIREGDLTVADGKVQVKGMKGRYEMKFLPIPEGHEGGGDPSYYAFDMEVGELLLRTKEALEYDLVHQGEVPFRVRGRGPLGGEEAQLEGDMSGLVLRGEKKGQAVELSDIEVKYRLQGDELTVDGRSRLGENVLPFSYWHKKEDKGSDWALNGWVKVDSMHLKEPLENIAVLVESMEGKSLTGKLAMKLDFTLKGSQDFQGTLNASIRDGRLAFADDGPVLEGIRGDIRLSSLSPMQTETFHRVTAEKLKAWDTEMTGLRVDYKILPDGGIQFRRVLMKALGGTVWLDPFVLPGGDKNYDFKVRMKRLDLAQLAKLFPDFNGEITGQLDGLLPMAYVNGEFKPKRGGMYLTPGKKAQLRYDAGNKFSGNLNPKGREYQQMKIVEDSLKNLELRVLSMRLFDPRDKDKSIVIRMEGQASSVKGAPPIHLNINGFKPDDEAVDFFDLLLRHRDKLNFGL